MMNTNPARRIGTLVAVGAGSLTLVACGSQAPDVGAVDLRTGAGSSISSAPSPDPPLGDIPPARAGLDGEYSVEAGDAGTVRFAVSGRQVAVQDVALNAGWQQLRDEREFDEVELAFSNGTTFVEVEAELDDGRFETDVDIDSPATPARLTFPVSDAGTVTVDVMDNGFVALVSQEAAAGWVATVDEGDLREGEVEIQFRNDGARRSVEFDAEVDDGVLEVDIDSKTGFNHFVRSPGR